MSALRALSAEGFSPPAAFSPGAVPVLQWIAIADLRVDESYQREIGATGRATIRKILDEFRWSKFAPVVVAALEGGFYAIIDGQHRTVAALASAGIERVPCMVTIADQVEQAAAFAAINGNTTAIHATQLFHAKVAAGDPLAVKVTEICRASDVVVLRSSRQQNKLKAGETLAIGALMKCAANDEATLGCALRCVPHTGDGNPGLLRSAIIAAFFDVLTWRPGWRADMGALLDALDDFPFATAWAECAVGETGTASWRYSDRIVRHLEPRLGSGETS